MIDESIAAVLKVVDALDKLGIKYFIGGSVASSLHGIARSTMDADIIVDMELEKAPDLVKELQSEFYVDLEMIADALQNQSSFNVVHLQSMFKVDLFVLKSRPFSQSEFNRRTRQALADDPDAIAFICSAEDLILAKLEWYQAGGRVSERQWRDVLGVLAVQKDFLDWDYLSQWAPRLGVSDLLEEARDKFNDVSSENSS